MWSEKSNMRKPKEKGVGGEGRENEEEAMKENSVAAAKKEARRAGADAKREGGENRRAGHVCVGGR